MKRTATPPTITEIAAAVNSAAPEQADHPTHYNLHPSGVECIDIIEHMPHNIGAAVKYLWRYADKADPLTDLRKAAWYVQREIERLEKAGVAS